MKNNILNKTSPLKVLSLFSGAGGMDLGFIKAGFEIVYANDFDKYAVETYKKNIGNHISNKNIFEITEEELPKDVDVIIGGPPCQGFSMAGSIGRKFTEDPRNQLYKEFSKIIGWIKPKYFIMENVARLYTHNKNQTREEIMLDLSSRGYKVEAKVLNSENYDVPQVRSRVIFIGVRDDIDTKILFPKIVSGGNKTVEESIGYYTPLQSGEICKKYFNHEAMEHSEQMLEKMSYIKDGGNRESIPKEIRPNSGDVRKYIRYESKKPSICITGDMRKVFHYSQNRALTVRELAKLQTFPDDFIFLGTKTSQQQQVGNAVPVLMAYEIAKSILKMEEEVSEKNKKVPMKLPKINYIGNKEKLSSWILENIPKEVESVFDAFSGGTSVSYALKQKGYRVISNDILKVNYTLAKALIENSKIKLFDEDIEKIFSGTPKEGFMYKNFKNIYYFEEECKELDLYYDNIQKLENEYKRALAFSLVRRAMVRKMPYSRFNISWDKITQLRDEEYSYEKYKRKRAYHNQKIKEHFLENLEEYNQSVFDNGRTNEALNEDIFEILEKKKILADLIYLDPPYAGTLNDYYSFYNLIDNYISQDMIEPFKNNFMNKKEIVQLFERMISNLSDFKYCMLSYHEKAFPTKEMLKEILEKYYTDVKVISKKHNYQVTGKEQKNQGEELLFIAKGFRESKGVEYTNETNKKLIQKILF